MIPKVLTLLVLGLASPAVAASPQIVNQSVHDSDDPVCLGLTNSSLGEDASSALGLFMLDSDGATSPALLEAEQLACSDTVSIRGLHATPESNRCAVVEPKPFAGLKPPVESTDPKWLGSAVTSRRAYTTAYTQALPGTDLGKPSRLYCYGFDRAATGIQPLSRRA